MGRLPNPAAGPLRQIGHPTFLKALQFRILSLAAAAPAGVVDTLGTVIAVPSPYLLLGDREVVVLCALAECAERVV